MSGLTILGGTGFIGSHLVRRLRAMGVEHQKPERGADLRGQDLGCLVYCVGITADFRQRLLETVDAHVCHLVSLLRDSQVSAIVYLSSTRVYRRTSSPALETDPVVLSPLDHEDVYDISKVMGEAVTLAQPGRVHVLRLSNVYGNDTRSVNFLSSLLRDAVLTGDVVLRTSPTSVKDYVSIDDVVDVIVQVAGQGTRPIYNVASGRNVSHQALVDRIQELTGCRVSTTSGAPEVAQPLISIRNLQDEFDYRPASVLDDLPSLVQAFTEAASGPSPR
ncbi:MAG: NAD(P)-dependent oxidoreductase [Actinomycetota bacterium]|nr:NAD(P)-dependent oxidoreductase [Actinomycetota bacterium]